MFSITGKVLLAPLAGISNSVYRKVNKKYGADIVFTEMVSADGIFQNKLLSSKYMQFSDQEHPIGVQIFGAKPDIMADAAKFVEETIQPDLIDINFGCPAKKVVRRNGGSALLKDTKLLKEITKAVVDAVNIPVTVKTRAGWSSTTINAVEVAKIVQDCGVKAITLHPRTQHDGFAGKSNWDIIGEVKQSVDIPVIGNGDINSAQDAKKMIDQTGCDSIMVARGAFGNPWIFEQIKQAINGEEIRKPTLEDKTQTCIFHLEKMIETFGLPKGVYDMRKHLSWYLKGYKNASIVRKAIFTENSPERVKQLIKEFFLSAEDTNN